MTFIIYILTLVCRNALILSEFFQVSSPFFCFMIYKGKIVSKIILLFNLFYQTAIIKKRTIRKMLWCTLWVTLKRDGGWQGSGDHWLGDLYQGRHPKIEETADREEILYFMEVHSKLIVTVFPCLTAISSLWGHSICIYCISLDLRS